MCASDFPLSLGPKLVVSLPAETNSALLLLFFIVEL